MHDILVVDDDPAIRDVVVDILAMSDYAVRTASNGAEALDEVRQRPPAAILLDLMMPVMNGWEFLRHCRRDAACARVPIVVMSAARDAATAADELGAHAFLAKPFELDDVLNVVDRLARGPAGLRSSYQSRRGGPSSSSGPPGTPCSDSCTDSI